MSSREIESPDAFISALRRIIIVAWWNCKDCLACVGNADKGFILIAAVDTFLNPIFQRKVEGLVFRDVVDNRTVLLAVSFREPEVGSKLASIGR